MVGKTGARAADAGPVCRCGERHEGPVELTERFLEDHFPLPDGIDRERYWDSRISGLGLVLGRRRASFIAFRRVKGEANKTNVTLGHWAPSRLRSADKNVRESTISVSMARGEAIEALASMRTGEDPREEQGGGRSAGGPTLREGLAIHVANMRMTGGKGRLPNGAPMPCSERSIKTLTDEVEKHLDAWLDRPIVELTALELTEVCAQIRARTKPRNGSVNPAGAALTKRIVSHVGAIFESTDALHDLPVKNPARKVTTHGLAAKEQRIEPGQFARWYAAVDELSPVRRDFNLLALYTGVRSEGLRHLQWDDVDTKQRVIHVRRAKGNRPYTIPMTDTVKKILERRRAENASASRGGFAAYGGDHGYVLPAITRSKPFKVIPMAEAKEYEVELDDDGERRHVKSEVLVGPHVLRKTWNSVAIEARIPAEDREALMNHEGRGVNVRHYGFPRNWDALRESARAVESALLERIHGKKSRARRAA